MGVTRQLARVAVLVILSETAIPHGHGDVVQEATLVSQESPGPRVTVPQSAGMPGGLVAVPIQFVGFDELPAGVLTLQIRYSTSKLTFSKVELGGLAVSVDAVASVKSQPDGDETLVEVTIATPAKNGSRAPLPDGPLAQLMFTVAKGEKPATVIPLKVEVTLTGVTPGAAPHKVPAKNGEIIVSNPVKISCFFYMH